MGGKSPVSIITDQDKAMCGAISKVFPNTRHRLCLWHIRKKFAEKLSHIYHKSSNFKRELKKCIRESLCIEDFEEDWHQIMVKYDLEKNEWLQGLYEIRESWIPIYNMKTFFAGMNTTQRSESINAFFDSFVDSSTTLRDFVVKFDKAVDSRYEKEKKEDFESRHRSRLLSVRSKIEKQAATIYTRNIFKKFQDELAKVSHFIKDKIEKNGSQYTYKVTNCDNTRESYTVYVDLDTRAAKCGCQLYEFMGILCRHILMVFQSKNIIEIPNEYILKRWTKDANIGIICGINENNSVRESTQSATLRSMHVLSQASLLSDLAKSENIYEFISPELEKIIKKARMMDSERQTRVSETTFEDESMCDPTTEEAEFNIQDPIMAQTKGRQKDNARVSQPGRIKSGLELSMNRISAKRRTCQICGEEGHNRRSCKQKISDEETIFSR
jgi:hypothetical protein